MSTPVIEKIVMPLYESSTDIADETNQQEDLSKKAHFISPAMNAQLWNILDLGSVGGSSGTRLLISYARANGISLVALCKYVWIPTEEVGGHDVCGACSAIANNWIEKDES